MFVSILAKNSGASAYEVIKEVPSTVDGYNIRKANDFIYSRPGYSYIGDSVDTRPIQSMYSFYELGKSIMSTSGCIFTAEHSGYNSQNIIYSGFVPSNSFEFGDTITYYGNNKSISVYNNDGTIIASDTSFYSAGYLYSAYSGQLGSRTLHIGVAPVVGQYIGGSYNISYIGKEYFSDVQVVGGVSLSADIPSGATGMLWLCADSKGSMPYKQYISAQASGTAIFNMTSFIKDNMYEYDYNSSSEHISYINDAMACTHKDRTWVISNNRVYKSAKGPGRGLIVNTNYIQINSNKKIDKIFSCGEYLLASSSSNVSGEIWKISDTGFDHPTLLTNQQGILSDKLLKVNDRWYFIGSSGISYFSGSEIVLIRQNTKWLNDKVLDIITGSKFIRSVYINDTQTNKSLVISTDGYNRIVYVPEDNYTFIDSIYGEGYSVDSNRKLISYSNHSIYDNSASNISDDGNGIEMKYITNEIYDFEDNPSMNYKLQKIAISLWAIENPTSSINIQIKHRAWDTTNNVLLPESSHTYNFTVQPYNGFITREFNLAEPSQILLSNSLNLEVSIPNSYNKKIKEIKMYFERVN